MSKKSNGSNGKALAPKEGHFIVNMPAEAPALGFDPMAGFSWQDIYPDNYWNEENAKAKKEALGGWPVLTPDYIALQPVPDPEDKEPDLSARLVMYFKEAGPALVFNKSRCQMATNFTGTSDPRQWPKLLGPIMLAWGDFNKRLQLVFEPAPTGSLSKEQQADLDALNEELFG